MVPLTPPSFVNESLKASLLMIGAFVSMPINDHVPRLKNAHSFPLAGIAATADAVSCDATATIGKGFTLMNFATFFDNCPFMVPGFMIGGNKDEDNFIFFVKLKSQFLFVAFNKEDVDAIEYSTEILPVNK